MSTHLPTCNRKSTLRKSCFPRESRSELSVVSGAAEAARTSHLTFACLSIVMTRFLPSKTSHSTPVVPWLAAWINKFVRSDVLCRCVKLAPKVVYPAEQAFDCRRELSKQKACMFICLVPGTKQKPKARADSLCFV